MTSSTRPHPIKQADITRALKAARLGGIKIESCEVDHDRGRIIIHVADDAPAAEAPYDRWKASRRGQG
jgi:hypothetical protein